MTSILDIKGKVPESVIYIREVMIGGVSVPFKRTKDGIEIHKRHLKPKKRKK